MDKNTRRGLLSSVDAFGKPKWTPATFDDLASASPEPTPGESGKEAPSGGQQPAGVTASQAEATPEAQLGAAPASAGGVASGYAPASQTAWPPRAPSAMLTEGESAEGLEPLGPEAGSRGAAARKGKDGAWVVIPNVAKARVRWNWRAVAVTAALVSLVALVALAARVVFLYFVTGPDILIPSWSNDTWHRWQIAYLSQQIGFHRGFLRLWDLKGMEYYWGLIHPLLLVGLFAVTRSVDIMILRWVTIVAGVLNVVFFYLVGARFWNKSVGLAAALLAALNPIVIFNDPSGMAEPLSFVFLLAAIYFFPRRSVLSGVLFAVASMARAEAWLFSIGLFAAAMLSREPSHRKIALGLGWGIPILAYMKYLLDRTGNALYPIYWNFLANAAGRWEFRTELTNYQIQARPVLAAVFIICLLAAVWVLWKRPRPYLLYLLGFGTTAFIAGFIGLTHYLKSYEPWFWLTRFFVFPYMFAGLLVAVFALGWLPSKLRAWGRFGVGWLLVIPVLLAMQLTWTPILHDVDVGYTSRTLISGLRDQGEFVGQAYTGGTVLIPEGNPQFTYALGRYSGIDGASLLGQMYGPTFYFEGGDPFEHWDVVGPQMWDWFERDNIILLVMNAGDRRFETMIQEHPERFESVGVVPHSGMLVYRVSTAP